MHPATLLLILPLASSTLLHPAAASNGAGDDNLTATCAPARCGVLNITYPFTLIGVQPPHCGYPAFELACDHLAGRAYLSRTFRERLYLVRNISYVEASMVVSVEATFAGNDSCRFPDFNVSSGLALFPLHIDAGNDDLVFVHNCSARLPRKLAPRHVSCGAQRIEAFVVNASEGAVADAVPENCSFVNVPVHRGGDVRDYERLILEGFDVEWERLGDCGACSHGGGECRFDEGSFRCFCDGSPCSRDRGKFRLKIGAGIAAAALLCLVVLSIAYIIYNVRRKRKRSSSLDNLIIRGGLTLASPKKEVTLTDSPLTHIFTYEELDEATDRFSDARVLGAGGFGTVYKGILQDGSVVAVKRMYRNNYKGVEKFANEVDILSRLRHPNLVTFYGCTSSESNCSHDFLLAYEFVPNGTLADHLNDGDGEALLLPWPTRLTIALEAASALAYLHKHQVVHRDVKTTNILLDEEFHVKVADFGLSRLFPPDATHVSTAPQGTPGYVDPTYHRSYQLTDKSDVYSFGVVLVQLISSRPAVDMSRTGVGADVNLASMAVRMIQCCEIEQLVDPRLGYGSSVGETTNGTVDIMAEIAFRCLQPEQDVRPSIEEVLDVLTEAHQRMMEKEGCTAGDDAVLLKKSSDGSPDSVMDQWISPSTTSNHSS
ncbi:unnamed protein product [Alopecurus aequalis]